jgi:glucans biosynthesis protein
MRRVSFNMKVSRRALLRQSFGVAAAVAGLRAGFLPAIAQETMFEAAEAFPEDFVKKRAQGLAATAYSQETIALPKGLDQLTYDQYRDIRFNIDKSIWKGEPHGFSFDVLHSGFYYTSPVDIYVIENDRQAKLKYLPDLFTFGPLVQKPDGTADLHYSGFRLRYPINRVDYPDEFAVFQGASYFRAVGKGLLYGLSARGLAINTGQPEGEEFPMFRAFWIRKPEEGANSIVVHALLDSPSVTGAYRFTIKPGEDTQMDVELELYPRRSIEHAGIAPLTSMYLFDAMHHAGFDDYRPAVHDSDGLMMLTGAGEWLWRPLANHKTLQVSAFQDAGPRGFGLMQRKRRFEDFADLEAKYEKRPSLWVEPIGDWGAGAVELFEIPTDQEIHDNIVAFWRPQEALAQGSSYSYVYRLHWTAERRPGEAGEIAAVHFSGGGTNFDRKRRLYVIEFGGGDLSGQLNAEVEASAGTIANIVIQPNEFTQMTRLSFELEVEGIDLTELRAVLKRDGKKVSETWLYRWTRD